MIDNLRSTHTITTLCDIARVSRGGYYAWKDSAPLRKQKDMDDERLVADIETCANKYIGTYGYRRMTMKLHGYGTMVNHKKVARVMKRYGMGATIRIKNPYKDIMKKTQEHRCCPNLLNRNFAQTVPQRVGGTDITYLWVPSLKRFVYLSVVKDFATGEILSHVSSLSLRMPLVLQTLYLLAQRLGDSVNNFMLHSDQGVHYTNPSYQARLANYQMIQSMSRKGNCIDNASTETFFGHMKDELDVSSCTSFHDVRVELATYISYYNSGRRQWTKKKMAPIAYRNHLLSTVKT